MEPEPTSAPHERELAAILDEVGAWRDRIAEALGRERPGMADVERDRGAQALVERVLFLRMLEARRPGALGGLGAIDGGRRGAGRRIAGLLVGGGETGALRAGREVDEAIGDVVARVDREWSSALARAPAELLGRAHERLVGDGRRRGGVYYTPAPIVEYIVEETLAPLLAGAAPEGVAPPRVLDPACGGGAFLLAAFRRLISWRAACCASSPATAGRLLEPSPDGRPRLVDAEQRCVLLDGIFGVDLDPRAVEVARLSLVLALVEDRRRPDLDLGGLLRDLAANVKAGNSLVDGEIDLPPGTPFEARREVGPFRWEAEFPRALAEGGFDAVVGNPPYLGVDAAWGRRDPRLAYLKTRYPEVHADKADLLFFFLARAASLCRGEAGLIVSRAFLEADKARRLRRWLGETWRVREVVDFRAAAVFPGREINTAILRLSRSPEVGEARFRRWRGRRLPVGYGAAQLRDGELFSLATVPQRALTAEAWSFGGARAAALLARLDAAGCPVGELLHVGKGMETGANDVFQLAVDAATFAALQQEGLVLRRARNSDLRAFHVGDGGPALLWVEDAPSFAALPALVQRHLADHRARLEARAAHLRGDCDWWRYTWPLHRERLRLPRILVPYRARDSRFAVDEAARYLGLTDTTVLHDRGQEEDLHYVAAVLNSRPLAFRLRHASKLCGGGTWEYFHHQVARLPVPRLRREDPRQLRIARRARELAGALADLAATSAPEGRARLLAAAEAAREEIEELVARLLGLTADDRRLLDEEA